MRSVSAQTSPMEKNSWTGRVVRHRHCSDLSSRAMSSAIASRGGLPSNSTSQTCCGDRQLDAHAARASARAGQRACSRPPPRSGAPPGTARASAPRPARRRAARFRLRLPVVVSTRSPMPASPAKVSGSAPMRDAQPRDLGEPAGDQRGARVVAQPEPLEDAGRDGDHVLERAGQLDARPRRGCE